MKKVCTTPCARARAGASRARAVTNIRGRIRMEQADIMVTLIPEAESF
jgi:pilus assembly protein TadC